MAVKHIKFSDIVSLERLYHMVKQKTCFTGLDDNGQPTFNFTRELPTITFSGTVKAHGSNCSVCAHGDDMWAQSRNNILPEIQHYDFYDFFTKRKSVFKEIIDKVCALHAIDIHNNTVSIFGEYVGNKMSRGAAFNNSKEPLFIIFAIKVTPDTEEDAWTTYPLFYKNNGTPLLIGIKKEILTTAMFNTWSIKIDFNDIDGTIAQISPIIDKIAAQCPMAWARGLQGPGEGVVWVSDEEFKGETLCFKTKTAKFQHKFREKTERVVDEAKEQRIHDFVEHAVSEPRFEQAISEVFYSKNIVPDVTMTSEIIKWIMIDIHKEESELLCELGLTSKDVSRHCCREAVSKFKAYLAAMIQR